MTTTSAKPTIVLVHGALEDASIWHSVLPRLLHLGYAVIAFANPLRGLGVDVTYLRSVLDTIVGDVILVAHAYGGAVITQGGDHPKVKGLIYAASPMPAAGETTTDCLQRFPGGDFASSINITNYTLPDGTSGAYALVQGDKYGALLADDVPEHILAQMIATQRPVDLEALNGRLTSAAWETKPSWQIRPLRDPVFPIEEWEFESARANAQVIEVNSSHAVPITFPDVVVDVIEQAAIATAQ